MKKEEIIAALGESIEKSCEGRFIGDNAKDKFIYFKSTYSFEDIDKLIKDVEDLSNFLGVSNLLELNVKITCTDIKE
jgi:hypothetical protein